MFVHPLPTVASSPAVSTDDAYPTGSGGQIQLDARGPAMRDVAKLAGVSHQTVSRVLNDHPSVRPQTRDRVLEAAQMLNYRRNLAARTLATRRSHTLGVISFETTLFGPASLLCSIEQAAREAGYFVSVATIRALDRSAALEAIDRLCQQSVEGIIAIAPKNTVAEALAHVPTGLAAVGVGGADVRSVPTVRIDNVAGAMLATQHLLDLGHRTVHHLGGPADWPEARDRVEGWRAALDAAGAPTPPAHAMQWSARSGYDQGKVLAADPSVTAVFCANDHIALGLLRALHEAGREVPGDVSVVGFDDVPESEYFLPPLTTIRQDFTELGRRSLDVLLDQLRTGRQRTGHIELAPQLIVRGSTGSAPAVRRLGPGSPTLLATSNNLEGSMVTSSEILGPVAPTAASHAVQQPIGIDDVEITGGPLGRWQQINRTASIPLGLRQVEQAGSVPNLRRAAGEADGDFQGYRFQDSDLYKQLEAVAWEHAREADPGYEAFLSESAQLLRRAQRPDGYLNSHYQLVKPDKVYAELEYSHEMYCAGHLLQAAVAATRAGSAPLLLEVAQRLADHLVAVFLDGGDDGIDGHPEIETALVELYRLTGRKPYLALAAKLIDNRGKGLIRDVGLGPLYAQDHLPVRHADTVVGHAVRQLYLEAGIVDVYLETGDRSLLDCSVRRWEDMVATKTYLTGGLGARHDGEAFGERFELPPDRAYNESCAAIASLHWNWRLLLATGDGRYADLFERTLYNAFAASTSADGLRFFYVNPLQRRTDHSTDRYDGRRRDWFECACCPPNIMRTVASLGHYLASREDDCLYLHQFAPGSIRSSDVELAVATEYPWDGRVSITVAAAPATWRLALRIPGWSTTVSVIVDGTPAAATPNERGYLILDSPREHVELELDMSPRLAFPHPRIDAVRGCAALERGPLVYCFEQADQRADLDGLALTADTELRVLAMHDLPGVGPTVLIEADAQTLHLPYGGLPYGDFPPPASVPVTATAVPYFQWDNRDGGAMRVWLPYM